VLGMVNKILFLFYSFISFIDCLDVCNCGWVF
jgi:hypothetical protein